MADRMVSPLRFVTSRAQVAEYAAISGDDSRIHLDDDVARAQQLPGVILHGMHTFGQVVSHLDRHADQGTTLRSVSCRFTGVGMPDAEVAVRFESAEQQDLSFRGEQSGRTVIDRGSARFA